MGMLIAVCDEDAVFAMRRAVSAARRMPSFASRRGDHAEGVVDRNLRSRRLTLV